MIIKAYKGIICPGKEKELEEMLSAKKADICAQYFDTGKIMNANVFSFGKELYVYIESVEEEVTPDELLQGIRTYLIPWTDAEDKYFYLLTEIFHFNEPQSIEHWSRKEKPLYCFGMLAKIVPELTARYIYYHYQFQEERPGMGDKYGRIFLMGDMAFYYGEAPEIIEEALHKGTLDTNNTPDDETWQSIMGTHFLWWEETYPACDVKTYDWKANGYPLEQRNHQWLYIKNLLSIV